MHPLDAEITQAEALLVDANPTSRSMLSGMLRNFGITHLTQTSRVKEARRLLENQHFDIVLCDYHFPDESMTGQEMVDDLRLANLLPLSTVFIMITTEAGYAKVAEACESALDGYLLRPHTEQALRERLQRARERKKSLTAITTLLDGRDFTGAAAVCQKIFDARGKGWLTAARIGGECYLRLNLPTPAQAMFEAILEAGALPWAKLGVARAQYVAGTVMQARRTLESLLTEQPGYADAYDVMARVLVEQGEFPKALEAMKRGSTLTPGSVGRLQKLGMLAFFEGEHGMALESLERASVLGLNSRAFDLQSLVLLALLQFDAGDSRGIVRTRRLITSARENAPDSARLRRFEAIALALTALREKRLGDSLAALRELLGEVREPNFEFEAATNVLMLMSRLQAHEVRLDDAQDHLHTIAARFCVSKSTTELLCRACGSRPDSVETIHLAHTEISTQAEDAASQTLNGAPEQAVELLLTSAERSLNAKLVDLALHTLDRHRDAIATAETALKQRAVQLRDRYCSYGTQVRLGKGTAR